MEFFRNILGHLSEKRNLYLVGLLSVGIMAGVYFLSAAGREYNRSKFDFEVLEDRIKFTQRYNFDAHEKSRGIEITFSDSSRVEQR